MRAGERVEALGFASLFANDHLMPILGDADGPVLGSTGPVFEGWMTLGAWAARTTRIPLGVMVCGVGYRNVGLTVKMATALDHASAGRAMLGLGAGWHEPEHRAFGYEMLTLGDRISRFDEASRLARGMLDGEPYSQDGRWVSAHEVRNDPPPVQARMPLLIGGSGERRTLRIVARDADIWNGEGDPATYAHKSAVLDAHCAEIGRDPASIRRTVGVQPVCIRALAGGGGRGARRDPDPPRGRPATGPRLGRQLAAGRYRGGRHRPVPCLARGRGRGGRGRPAVPHRRRDVRAAGRLRARAPGVVIALMAAAARQGGWS